MLTTPAPRPARTTFAGQSVDIVPLDAERHSDALFDATRGHDELWTYLFDGPFAERASFAASMRQKSQSDDPLFYAIVDRTAGLAVGHAALMRIEPAHRVIEVGSILYTPKLQRTRGATEAMYLMARYVFEDLGYRRYEWKCHSENAPSRSAALRLGFSYEGLFRQHMIIKGRNRDTAWYSMIDSEWPARKARFEQWLTAENFEPDGRQRTALSHQPMADG
jgi:RimJ/RimL family protein N-acetyltransferase